MILMAWAHFQLSEEHVKRSKSFEGWTGSGSSVIKVDKAERRNGLSIKAAHYSDEELRRETEAFDSLRPGEDMVGLEQAFQAAEEEYRPSDRRK
jgi:small subunit ribosomal protein S1